MPLLKSSYSGIWNLFTTRGCHTFGGNSIMYMEPECKSIGHWNNNFELTVLPVNSVNCHGLDEECGGVMVLARASSVVLRWRCSPVCVVVTGRLKLLCSNVKTPLNEYPGLHQGGVLKLKECFWGAHCCQEGGLSSSGAADPHDQGGNSIMGSSLGVILPPGGEVNLSKMKFLPCPWPTVHNLILPPKPGK